MNSESNSAAKPVIYYDASCPMCSAFVAGQADKAEFKLVDNASPDLPADVNANAANRGIHFRGKDGKVLKNLDAVLGIWEQTDSHPIFRRVAKLPVLSFFFSLGYRIVAANRQRLSVFFARSSKASRL